MGENSAFDEPDSRTLDGRMEADGSWQYKTCLTPESHGKPVDLKYDSRRVIPVILIPGIMATRLRMKKTERKVWDPPNMVADGFTTGLVNSISALWEYLWKSTEERVRELDPDNTEVNDSMPDKIQLAKAHPECLEHLKNKGWGGLYADAYHPFMQYLESTLNQKNGELPDVFKESPQEYGSHTDSPISEEEYEHVVGNFRFEVWGGGYNWLHGNATSAEDVWKFVTDTVLKHYHDDVINKAKQVLIVSHSMGGLVTRAICKNEAYSKQIMGVVHIAQPAAGAPLTYKRMRSGFEGIGQVIMGRNAADVTGILGRAQGGLELLPFGNYKLDPWLICPDNINSSKPKMLDLPKGEPYDSIYKEWDKWYGLLPKYNLHYILADREATEYNLKQCRKDFADLIKNVKTFHEEIATTYHDVTYAIWGDDIRRESWEKVHWKHKYYPSEDRDYFGNDYNYSYGRSDADEELNDNGNGYIGHGPCAVFLQDGDAPGDGTVPAVSARDQAEPAKQYFVHGNKHGDKNKKQCWEHSEACNDSRVHWCTAYSIIKIVSKIEP